MSPQNDAAFLRMFLIILGALVAFTVLILFVANQVVASDTDDPRLRAAIAERIAPVGRVNVATPPAPAPVAAEPAVAAAQSPAAATEAPAAAPEAPAATTAAPAAAASPVAAAPVAAAAGRSGEAVYNAACTACHLIGVLGSPKLGDTEAWTARLAVGGFDGLVGSVINGKGNMPPRGGANVTDAEIKSAVEHMLTASGVEVGASEAAGAATEQPVSPATSAAPAVEAVSEPATVAAAMAAPAPAPASAPAASAEVDLAKGKTVYDTACFACHATGAAGAPKLGDPALWAPRIAKGMETLNHNAINGIGAMPAKGGRVDLADADITAAVAYMLEQSK